MPTKINEGITVKRFTENVYKIISMKNISNIHVLGNEFRVGSKLEQSDLNELQTNWVCDETDEDRNSVKRSLSVKE